MKSSKDMTSKPGQTKATTNGKPTATNNKPGQSTSKPPANGQARTQTAPPKGTTAAKPGTGARPGTAPTGRPGATGSRTGAPRSRAVVPQRRGFRMRPVDMIITGVAVLVFGLIVWAIWSSASPGGTGSTVGGTGIDASLLKNGTAAPDFSLPGTDGKTHTLSEFKGKPLVIEFMAPWCPHCQDDAPIFDQVYSSYKDKVGMIGINASPYGHNHENNDNTLITMDDLTWFRDNFKVQYPLLFDKPMTDATSTSGQPDTAQRAAYGVEYFPTIYIIDKDGKVFDHVLADTGNAITYDRIAAILDKAQ